MGLLFDVRPTHVDETPPQGLGPVDAAVALALRKAKAMNAPPQDHVLAADTIVAMGPELFGKPKDTLDASRLLMRLSGRTHEVITGVAIVHEGRSWTASDVAKVHFAPLRRDQVEAYVATGEPLDKAGAYALQGGAAAFITGLEGDPTTVIGLPLRKTLALLAEAGYPLSPHLKP